MNNIITWACLRNKTKYIYIYTRKYSPAIYGFVIVETQKIFLVPAESALPLS